MKGFTIRTEKGLDDALHVVGFRCQLIPDEQGEFPLDMVLVNLPVWLEGGEADLAHKMLDVFASSLADIFATKGHDPQGVH